MKNSESTTAPSKNLNQWVGYLKVGHKIGLGYGLAIFVAILGTTTGFVIGDSYHNEALEREEKSLNAYRLVNDLQTKVLLIRLDWLELPIVLDKPQLVKKQSVAIQQHQSEFKQLWVKFKSEFDRIEEEKEESILRENDSARQLFKTYSQFSDLYLKQVEELINNLNLDNIQATQLETTKTKLTKFSNTESSRNLEYFARDLLSLSEEMYEEYEKAEAEFAVAQRLRLKIFFISAVLSVLIGILLAILTSRAISKPLQAVTNVAQKTTQEANFDLQAPVTTSDETGKLATSLNQLIARVKQLLIEKEQKSEQLQKANEKLITTQKQMVAQEKLASLGSLTAGIAHEIRNPLNFVNNFAQLSVELIQELLEEIAEKVRNLDKDTVESLTDTLSILETNVSKIEHHGQRAEKIVSNMLLHARSGGHKWESSNLNQLVEETVNLAYHGMRAKDSSFNLTIDNDYDETVGEIEVVTQDISRAFLNIISNACYAIQQKLKQQGNEFTPMLKVRTKNLEQQVEIRIRDNGSGMTREVRDRIFEHFFTTKPTGEGTGLGLSLTYDIIVQQHQGSLEVESEVDIYTEFIISLPKNKSAN
ncbi:histidine kinase with HAMP domain [Rivularia sp. PCC 7116]|uniref:sensor histidine kinase n=1 Tax=Rivularia sp. PCC 7116 TaxID=373994 RepID=UPI00029ED8BD|nr:ATP-binding protein [Rivularia sp. PCC 7116]AFY54526.1 histidine kinase with HAMP domain [Rivularia sp. PCC 7116]